MTVAMDTAHGDETWRIAARSIASLEALIAVPLGLEKSQPSFGAGALGSVSERNLSRDTWDAQAGLTEAKARATHDVVTAMVRTEWTTRAIIDGRTIGFCKLVVDRATRTILGCHIVGDRAVDIAQTAAIAIAAGMRVHELARIPLSFPTYTGILGRAAAMAARQLDPASDHLARELT